MLSIEGGFDLERLGPLLEAYPRHQIWREPNMFFGGAHTSSGTISIAAGCLEGPTGLAADRHIFVADAGDYYQLDDGLPIYPLGD